MRKKSLLLAAAGLFAGFSFLSSCTKQTGHFPPSANADVPCKIKVYSFINQGVRDSITFSYNALGNPVLGLRAKLADGTPDLRFLYDSHNRLIAYEEFFHTNDAISNLTKYVYKDDKSETPYLDSSFLFPNNVVNNSPGFYYNLWTTNFQYDNQNRITQTFTQDITDIEQGNLLTFYSGISDTTIFNYSYGPNGNMVGHTGYDNKINFLRTSKVFQFLQSNYSVNNSAQDINVTKYNQYGLPVEFGPPIVPNNGQSIGFLNATFNNVRIEYDCSCTVSQQKGL